MGNIEFDDTYLDIISTEFELLEHNSINDRGKSICLSK